MPVAPDGQLQRFMLEQWLETNAQPEPEPEPQPEPGPPPTTSERLAEHGLELGSPELHQLLIQSKLVPDLWAESAEVDPAEMK